MEKSHTNERCKEITHVIKKNINNNETNTNETKENITE